MNRKDYGLGVSLADTGVHRGVRILPLPDFPAVEIAALWLGRPTPLVAAALKAMRTYAATRWSVPPFFATPALPSARRPLLLPACSR